MDVTYDNLLKVYITENKSLIETAEIFNLPVGTLRKKLAKFKIKKTQKQAAVNSKKVFIERYGKDAYSNQWFSRSLESARKAQEKGTEARNRNRLASLAARGISKETLEEQYLTQNMSLRQLCELHNLSKSQVRKLLAKFDIKKSDSLAKAAKQRESTLFYEDEERWRLASIKAANTIKETYGNNWYRNTSSKEEGEVLAFIESLSNLKIERNTYNVIQNPYTKHWLQLDFYLPEVKLAFEYNGIYWHDKDAWLRDKHNKTYLSREALKEKLCEEKEIMLYHIWSDDWKLNRDREKDSISSLLKMQEAYAKQPLPEVLMRGVEIL